MAKSALQQLKEKQLAIKKAGSDPLINHDDKKIHLDKTQKTAKKVRAKKEIAENKQAQIERLQTELDEREAEAHKRTVRNKRKQKRKRKTVEDIEELHQFLEQGETRIAILTEFNDKLNVYSRKIGYNTNTLLSEIVYNFLKEKGEL